jgi:uncharacterized low-complexity protein
MYRGTDAPLPVTLTGGAVGGEGEGACESPPPLKTREGRGGEGRCAAHDFLLRFDNR